MIRHSLWLGGSHSAVQISVVCARGEGATWTQTCACPPAHCTLARDNVEGVNERAEIRADQCANLHVASATTWGSIHDFPEKTSKQASWVRSPRTPSPPCWLVWAHRQVHAWRTTASTRCTGPCQYPDTAGNRGQVGPRTAGGARGATPPSCCARSCASSWRCPRRGRPPVASPALAPRRPGTYFAPLSLRQWL